MFRLFVFKQRLGLEIKGLEFGVPTLRGVPQLLGYFVPELSRDLQYEVLDTTQRMTKQRAYDLVSRAISELLPIDDPM